MVKVIFESVVVIDDILKNAAKAFDYEFNGISKFELPDCSLPIRDGNWGIGLILGSSGSGKTKLLETVYENKCIDFNWEKDKAIVSHFPSYEEAIDKLGAVGLNSIPSWCKPFHVLSNGEQFRVNMAMKLKDNVTIDEFTSVVDRQVAKSCSNSIKKYITRKNLKGIVLAL